MIDRIDLGGIWHVTHTDGLHGAPGDLVGFEVDRGRFFPVSVPMEVHHALQCAGVLPDLTVACNTLAARWVEDQWWIYRHMFEVDTQTRDAAVWLVLEGLDLQAIIYLNGQEVGRHANAHRPCRLDLTGRLQSGANLLAVAVEGGLYYAGDRSGGDYSPMSPYTWTYLPKRHWLRKGQFEAGWDMSCRLLNVGITGPVRLEVGAEPRLLALAVVSTLDEQYERAVVQVRAFVQQPGQVCEATLRVRVVEAEVEEAVVAVLACGDTRVDVAVTLERPSLWWPRGHGPQALYTVEVTLERDGVTLDHQMRRTGIRRVRLMQEPHPEGGRSFVIAVNDRPIFCKGANCAPADMIPSLVTKDRLRELVDLAVGANFNFLRIWGGGVFAGHDLLDLCDEMGVLVWHDFLFACTRYPSDDPAFLDELRTEITWAIREFSAHPSLALWCGNNEQEWAAWEWGFDRNGKALPDYALYHHVIPTLLAREDPSRPYWPSSPYSPEYQAPNDPHSGDQHPWGVGMPQGHGTDFWAYRTFDDRFPNEGGVLATPVLASLERFLPHDERTMASRSWIHHDNSFNYRHPTMPIAFQMVDDWLGRDAATMSLKEYTVASGLIQAEALSEYIANYRRRMFSSAAAVFWVLADSWPTTHSFSIVDYYRTPKLAYHPVRRGFAPVTVVVAQEKDVVIVYGVNDTPADWMGDVRHGIFTLSGDYPSDRYERVTIAANSSTPLASIDRARWEEVGLEHSGAFAVLYQGDSAVAQHRLFLVRFKDLAFVEPQVQIELQRGMAVFTCDTFVWRVCLDVSGYASGLDTAFDLLPGVPYVVPWQAEGAAPVVVGTGNELVAGRASALGKR